MLRKMQTNLRLTLILFCLHPELLVAQSQKSQNWRVPVVPQNGANSDTEEGRTALQPAPELSRQFDLYSDSLLPERFSPSEKYADKKALRTASGTQDILKHMGVLSAGGESGRWGGGRLSIRGHSGSEPAASVDGVLLSSGFSGAHSEEFIPISAVAGVRAYPFFPAFGMPHAGVAGGYDIELVAGPQAERSLFHLGVEWPKALSVGGRASWLCSDSACLQFFWGGGFYRGEMEIQDDRNTPQDTSDDGLEKIKLSDVSRVSSAARSRVELGTGSRLETTFIAGAEARGTSGLPLSSVSEKNRLARRLIFFSHGVSHLSPYSGLFGSAQISARQEGAEFNQDLKTRELLVRRDQRNETVVTAAGHLSIPLTSSDKSHRVLVESIAERNAYKSIVSLAEAQNLRRLEDDSQLKGELVQLLAGGGLLLIPTESDALKMTINLQNGQSVINRACGVFAPAVLCAENKWRSSEYTLGGVFEWTRRIHPQVFLFTQAGRTSRLPRPLELAGRPDGIVANPELKSEQTFAAEVGLRSRFARLSIFAADDRNLISAEQVSPFLLRYENTSSVRRIGISGEGGIKYSLFEMSGNFETVVPKILEGRQAQRVLPFVPDSWFRVSLSATNVLSSTVFHVDFDRSGSYWLDYQGVSQLSPPSIVNLRLEAPVTLELDQMELMFSVRNVLDSRMSSLVLPEQPARSVPWSLSPVLPVQGRSFEVSFRLRNQ